MRKTFLSMLAVLGLLVSSQAQAVAQADDKTPPPLAVVSVASYDTWMANLEYIGQLHGKPYRMLLEGVLNLFTGGEGLQGWDKSKPAGMIVGGPAGGVTFLPVVNLDKFLQMFAAFDLKTKDVGDGVLEVQNDGQRVYLKAQGGWVWAGRSAVSLQNLPEDPVKLLGGLNETYDIAARLNFQSIPAPLVEMALASMREGAEEILEREPDESEEEFKARKETVLAQLDAVKKVIKDLDQLTVGFKIDRDAKNVFLEFEITFLKGSESAQQLAAARNLKSNFQGFNDPDALFSMTAVGPIQENDREQLRAMLQQFRTAAKKEIRKLDDLKDDAARAQVEQVVDGLLDILNSAAEQDTLDLGATLVGDGPYDLVLGLGVKDSKQAALNLLSGVEMLRDYKVVSKDAAEVIEKDGLRIESFGLTLPENVADDLNPFFGEKARLIVASGPQGVYAGLGETAAETLQKVVADSKAAAGKPAKPLEMTFSMSRLIKAGAQGKADNRALAVLANAKVEPGSDVIRLEETISETGGTIRIEAGEGVIKLIGAAANEAGRAAPQF